MKKFIFFTLIILLSIYFFGCGKKVIKNDINVTVLDGNSNPIKGVNLSLDGKSGTTDSNGKYIFVQIEEGAYTLKASKEGFEEKEENISVSEGKKQEIKIVLNEKTSFEEIKNYSDIESFHLIAEYRTKEAKYDQKFEIISENYGKKEYLKASDLNSGELHAEIFMDEKTAKIRYEEGGDFYELKREEVGSIAESFSSMVNELINGVKDEFNKSIKTPEGSLNVSIKKVGTEKVNDYPTTKYVYEGETTYQNQKTKFMYEIWTINGGDFKNYPTKLNGMIVFEDNSIQSFTINIFDLGKAKVPNP
ncbi:MAG: carboxypeptidase-like regulatory domain-containing protein [Caldisericia bacterium]